MRSIPYTGIIFILTISIILVIPAALFGLCTLFDFRLMHGEYDPMSFALSFENAHEGTVKIEPLVRSESGEYTAAFIEAYGDDRVSFTEPPKELMKRYGKFKAAYIDENGNVLGVTEAARIRYGNSELPRLAANGDKLEYFTGDIAEWQMTVLLIVSLLEPLAAAALIVIIVLAIINSVCETAAKKRRCVYDENGGKKVIHK